MDKSKLKAISMITTGIGAVVTVIGSLASIKLQELEIEEKVSKAFEQMSK